MEHKTVINTLFIFIVLFSLSYAYPQCDKDFYSLYKGGKKYKKITGYVMLHEDSEKIIKDNNTIIYNIGNASFEHNKKCHIITISSLDEIKNIKINTLKELGDIKEKVLNLRLKQENIKTYPRPLNHKMLKIYLIEQLDSINFRKIEVEWLYYQ